MSPSTTFARRVFLGAGVYGIASLLPQYFLEDWLGRHFPPALTHPELFYGFIGVTLAWQFALLLIAHDVVRFRPLMLVAATAKLLYVLPIVVLHAQGRVASIALATSAVDLVLVTLFLLAYWQTPAHSR